MVWHIILYAAKLKVNKGEEGEDRTLAMPTLETVIQFWIRKAYNYVILR